MDNGNAKAIGVGKEVVGRRKSGEIFPMDLGFSEFRLDDRRFLTWLVRDLTEKKKEESIQLEHNQMVKLFIRHTPITIAMFDMDMRYILASQSWKDEYKIEYEDIVGRSHYDVFPNMPKRWRAIHQRALAGAIERCDGEKFVLEDGSDTWIQWEIRPWRRADNVIGGIVIWSQVITVRKKAEQDLQASEERLRLLIGSVKDYAITTLDPNGYITSWNAGAERIIGYGTPEIIGKHFSIFLREEKINEHFPERELGIALKEGRFEDEGWRKVLGKCHNFPPQG